MLVVGDLVLVSGTKRTPPPRHLVVLGLPELVVEIGLDSGQRVVAETALLEEGQQQLFLHSAVDDPNGACLLDVRVPLARLHERSYRHPNRDRNRRLLGYRGCPSKPSHSHLPGQHFRATQNPNVAILYHKA